MALAELFRSFEDLWTHFDSVDASRWGAPAPLPALDPFDDERGAQHAAAFRALGVAVEELDLETLDEEVDRTLLLGALRTRLRRLERERAEQCNPALWCHRLLTAVIARGGEAAILVRIPPWAEDLRRTLRQPPLIHLQVALDYLAETRLSLQGESWWQSDKEALSQANSALAELERFLRHEVAPDPDPLAGALGADQAEWRLKHEHLLEYSGAEADRRLRRRLEQLADPAAGSAKGVDPAIRQEGVRQGDGDLGQVKTSELRTRLVHPAWHRAWSLYAAFLARGQADGRRREALLTQARVGTLDLAIQLATISPAAAAERLAVPVGGSVGNAIGALLVAPLEEAATTLLIEEWEQTRASWFGDDASFIAAVRQAGLSHPLLAAWRLGVGG